MTKFRNLKNLSLFCLRHFCSSVNVVMRHYIALSRNTYISQTKKLKHNFFLVKMQEIQVTYIEVSFADARFVKKSLYTGMLYL